MLVLTSPALAASDFIRVSLDRAFVLFLGMLVPVVNVRVGGGDRGGNSERSRFYDVSIAWYHEPIDVDFC